MSTTVDTKPEREPTIADPGVRRRLQQTVLDAIVGLVAETGYPPSEREIARHVGITLTLAHTIVDDLVKLSCITKVPKVSRTIVVRRTWVP